MGHHVYVVGKGPNMGNWMVRKVFRLDMYMFLYARIIITVS